jgi:hypothetical protein
MRHLSPTRLAVCLRATAMLVPLTAAAASEVASQPAAATKLRFNYVTVPAAYYEYKADGAGTIGLITSPPDKRNFVNFTTCSNRTVSVSRADLRQSKGQCPKSSPDSIKLPWTVASNELLPIFKVSATSILVNYNPVDVSALLNSNGPKLALPSVPASAPIAFAFKDLYGKPAIAVLTELAPPPDPLTPDKK